MALPRPSCLRGAIGRSTLRRAGHQARSKSFRDVSRRTYASGHEEKKSSDLPWIIGSVAVTVPAATWLLGQAPTKSDHGHEEEHVVVENEGESEEEEEQPQDEESKDEGEDKSKDEGEDKAKDDGEESSKDEGEKKPKAKEGEYSKEEKPESDDSDSDDNEKDTPDTSDDEQEYDPPGPNAPGQINKNPRKGPGELQKGDRNRTEKKGEKDAQKDRSGALNPHMGEPGKSQKAEGITETAKIHGTVDPRRRSSKED